MASYFNASLCGAEYVLRTRLSSPYQEIRRVLWCAKINFLVSTHSQINTVYILSFYLFKINPSVILACISRSCEWILSSFPHQSHVYVVFSPNLFHNLKPNPCLIIIRIIHTFVCSKYTRKYVTFLIRERSGLFKMPIVILKLFKV